MNFKLDEAIEVLERTPKSLETFLTGLLQCLVQFVPSYRCRNRSRLLPII